MGINTFAELEAITSLRGMEEFKRLAVKLCALSENRSILPAGARVPVPNLLFVAAPRVGVTTNIRLLYKLIKRLGLKRFVGNEPYFEWMLDKRAFDMGGAFYKLIDRIKVASGFYDHFEGIIGLDVSEWLDKANLPEFSKLMALADNLYGQVMFIFIVNMPKSSARTYELMSVLRRQTPLITVNMPHPTSGEYADYLCEKLCASGYDVPDKTRESAAACVKRLCLSARFDGYQTVLNFLDEIILSKCMSPNMRDNQILPCHLEAVMRTDMYNKTLCDQPHTIGFQLRRDAV